MIDARRQDDQIVLLQLDPDPVVSFTPHIEEALPIQYVPDFLVLVQVLIEEHLDLVLINSAHLLRRDCDLISVLVAAVLGYLINGRHRRTMMIENPQLTQTGRIDWAPRIVVLALVALDSVLVDMLSSLDAGIVRTGLLSYQ